MDNSLKHMKEETRFIFYSLKYKLDSFPIVFTCLSLATGYLQTNYGITNNRTRFTILPNLIQAL
jgi:hypothetical protein